MFKKSKKAHQPVQSPVPSAETAAFPGIGTTLPNPYYGSAAMAAPTISQQPSGKGRMIRTWLKRFAILVLILVFLSGILVGGSFLVNAGKTFRGSLFGLLQSDKLRGEDAGRVNILLAGNSADDTGHDGAQLTDSIMILSIDTKNNTAFMMSIPRDLYVDIPGHGFAKINEAYPDGQNDHFSEDGYPGGGMGLLDKVLTQDFGLELHYYALIDYSAFRDAVDAVGGIDVNIQSTDPRGLYDPSRDWTKPYKAPLVKLSNGPHHLDGQEALNLARARGDTYGAYGYDADYTRTANQRLMLVALKQKATSAGVALNPIRIASLLNSMGNNVSTDFKTSEVRRLADIAKKVPDSSIKSVGLNNVNGKSLLKSYTTRSGQSALVPAAGIDDYTAIQAYISQLTTPPAASNSSNSGQ